MSNSLIPYSFTPGTKAKAQEVNANFIALSEKIEENRAYTTSQIAYTVEKIEQVSADANAQKADTNLGNTSIITNCVLEAPNGVVTVTDNVITVKKGLKVLIPMGFNEDGTIKNTVFEVLEDTDVTTVSNSYLNCIYVTPNGCSYAEAYYTCEKEPNTKQGLWYRLSENKTYIYNTDQSAWESIDAVVITVYENVNGTVTLNQTAAPLRLLTLADKMDIITWSIPRYELLVAKAVRTTYIAPTAGYLYFFGVGQCSDWIAVIINNTQFNFTWVLNGTQAGNTAMFPLKRGDSYYVKGNIFMSFMYFLPMEGEL